MCDVENLLHLLSHEDEKFPALKEIPADLLPVEYKGKMDELRNSLQSCYSISNTLKQRFKQQKTLIKKAQERIRKQIQEFNDYKEEQVTKNTEMECKNTEMESKNNEMKRTCEELERTCQQREDSVAEYKKKILTLQVRTNCFRFNIWKVFILLN